MTDELTTGHHPISEPPWGKAHPIRGAKYHDLALSFAGAFPVGTVLRPDEFDQWAQHAGHLNLPEGAPKQSDAWKAHLQRRHELRYRINTAGSHPRMPTPFVIVAVREGVWEVRAPATAVAKTDLTERLTSLCKTKRRQLAHLMQSADWSALPPHERAFAEALYDDTDMFEQKVDLECKCLATKFDKLKARLRRGIEAGTINPQNGGIRGLLSSDDESDQEP